MESVEKMGMKTIEYVNVSKYNTSRRMACMANTVGWRRWNRYFLRIGDFHKYLIIKGEI
jgi:hypothetical protein